MGVVDILEDWLDTVNAKNEWMTERESEKDMPYREKAVRTTPSNHGWYTCPKCKGKFHLGEMEADHILPRSRGGSDSIYNLQLLCMPCNRSKRADTSDTKRDLKRRKQELKQQKKEYIAAAKNRLKQERKNQ